MATSKLTSKLCECRGLHTDGLNLQVHYPGQVSFALQLNTKQQIKIQTTTWKEFSGQYEWRWIAPR